MAEVSQTHHVQVNCVQFSTEPVLVQGLRPNPEEDNDHS